MIKYGLIRDPALFDWLEKNMARLVKREAEPLAYAIERSCAIKAEIVAQDEREDGVRALLNLGHTFGHAIEAGTGYGAWLHGEAVGAGMVLAARLSQRLGLIGAAGRAARSSAILARPPGCRSRAPDLGLERYLELMGHDKKVEAGRIRFVLLKRIGEAYLSTEVPREALADVLGTAQRMPESERRPVRGAAGTLARAPSSRAAAARPQRIPARPRPHHPLHRLPPPRIQDPGLRQSRRRPVPHPADPQPGSGADRALDRAQPAISTRI